MLNPEGYGINKFTYEIDDDEDYELDISMEDISYMQYLKKTKHQVSFDTWFSEEKSGYKTEFVEYIIKAIRNPGVVYYFVVAGGSQGPDCYSFSCQKRVIFNKDCYFVSINGLQEKMTETEKTYKQINFFIETVKGCGYTKGRNKLQLELESILKERLGSDLGDNIIFVNYRFFIYFDNELENSETCMKKFYKKKIESGIKIAENKFDFEPGELDKMRNSIFKEIDAENAVAKCHTTISGVVVSFII